MISRAQQILLKRAQAEAALHDAEYRDAIEIISGLPGCRSSKDPRLTDRHVDNLLAYFEAIYWRKIDTAALPPIDRRFPVFARRSYWATKNPKANTSRDRYVAASMATQISALESQLTQIGFGFSYLRAIANKTRTRIAYKAALQRTLKSKQNRLAEMPF